MSAAILQRVVVRMLHDPAFRDRVYADPDHLADLDLTPAERRLLVRADPRAWAVDVHRSDRVLTALLSELVISALALRLLGVPLSRLHTFFQSSHFHTAIMQRRSLVPAFADHLAGLASDPRFMAILTLERALVDLRRAAIPSAPDPGTPQPTPLVRLAPHARPVEVAAGTLAAWDRARKALGPEPLAALVAPRRGTWLDVIDPRAREWVLLEMQGGEPVAGFIGESLGRLLQAAASPTPRAALASMTIAEGADPNEAEEILDDLGADGLLVPA